MDQTLVIDLLSVLNDDDVESKDPVLFAKAETLNDKNMPNPGALSTDFEIKFPLFF